MERFAINILHKRIYKICRLCGVDNPVKVPIIEEGETIIVGDGDDEEATLAKKIEECVGIQVNKDDKMPQNICSLCVDKICDFYEYRLMCAATNLQTRTILNLNLVEPTRKLLNFGSEVKIEDKKEDVKKVVEVATSSSSTTIPSTSSKKGKKRRGPPSPSPSPAPTTRVKAPVDIVKDEPVPTTPVKALTKKERLKQLQQQKEKEEKKKKDDDIKKDKKDDKIKKEDKNKKDEKSKKEDEKGAKGSKRKEPSPAKEVEKVEPSVPPPKKIKFEHPCSYCSDEFKTQVELDSHLSLKHSPSVRKFGCGSCRETFDTILESKDHNLWHQLTRTLYTCFKCKRKYDKNIALVKHMTLNSCGRISRGRPPTIVPDIQCRLCSKKFKTQSLYEWHSCFIKPKAKCPKCGKYFVKKQILTRHYIMFCTGTLPPPEPIIIPKEEPIDPSEKPAAGAGAGTGSTNADRRTRRSAVTEPELPKEEREIPFPPPLELAPDANPTPAPSGSKKKGAKKDQLDENSSKLATTALEAEKIASLLNSGAKLDRDTDIATINNLLSSVTEAIASISEAKAKKKKKKKEKNKEKEVKEPAVPPPPVAAPKEKTVKFALPVIAPVEQPPPPMPIPPEPVIERSEEEKQAYALAQEVGEMTLDQQLAFCSDKLPIVVLAKTTFKQEITEIDTEPSQLQEPMDEDDDGQGAVENGDEYDGANDYSAGFQDDDDDDGQEEQQPPQPAAAEQTQEIPFPVPIKQEPEEAEPTASEEQPPTSAEAEAPQQQAQPVVEPAKEQQKQSLYDEQLAVNIKKEPGLEEEEEPEQQQPPATKRKRPGSRSSANSPASSLSSEAAKSTTSAPAAAGSPKPTLILKIKKEKGLLNASVAAPVSEVRTIVIDDDDEEEEDNEVPPSAAAEPEPPVAAATKKKVYKKPNILAVRIKQEKVDPGYDKQEQAASGLCDLPGGIRIKQERLDPDEEQQLPAVEEPEEEEEEEPEEPPPQKKSRSSPIVAFDGVRIKQEKPDSPKRVAMVPTPPPPAPAAEQSSGKSSEKKKKSKVKINPFALLRQKMAAEAAAKQAAEAPSQPQAPSPLPVITNVVGSAATASTSSSSSPSASCSGESTPVPEQERSVPVISQVTSIASASAAEERHKPEQLPVAIKEEPVDEEEEEEQEQDEQQVQEEQQKEQEQQEEQEEQEEQQEEQEEQEEQQEKSVANDFPVPIKEEVPENAPGESLDEEEEAEEDEEAEEKQSSKEDEESKDEEQEEESNEDEDEPKEAEESEEKEPESASTETETPEGAPVDRVEGEKEKDADVPVAVEKEEQESQQEATNGSEEEDAESSEKEEDIDEKDEDSRQEVQETENNPEDEKRSEEENGEEQSPAQREDSNQEQEHQKENPEEDTNHDRANQPEIPEQESHAEDDQLNHEPENSTSPISDVPMDDYDQDSQDKEPSPEDAATGSEISENGEQNQTAMNALESTGTGNNSVESSAPSSLSGPSDTMRPASPLASTEPATESPPEPTIIASQNSRLESDLEELQNLLTKGLEPPSSSLNYDGETIHQPSSTGIDGENMAPTCSTATSLEDDLDSLLNNKLEEISDQLKHSPAVGTAGSSTPTQDEINLVAIERELLHDMMPVAVQSEQPSSLPNSNDQHLLEIGQDRLPEGTSTGQT